MPEAPAVEPPTVAAPTPEPEERQATEVTTAASATATPAPARSQLATIPPGEGENALRLEFETGSAKLPDTGRQPLQDLAGRLDDQEDLRIQLRAYAGGTAETSSLARRLSLSRALAVRSYLIEQGVRSTRMDVRALGNKSGDGPADRVDIILVQR